MVRIRLNLKSFEYIDRSKDEEGAGDRGGTHVEFLRPDGHPTHEPPRLDEVLELVLSEQLLCGPLGSFWGDRPALFAKNLERFRRCEFFPESGVRGRGHGPEGSGCAGSSSEAQTSA